MAHDENVREDYRPLTGREREILEMLLSVEAPGMNQLRVASGVGFPGSTLLVASQPWIGRAMLSPDRRLDRSVEEPEPLAEIVTLY